MKSIFHVGPLLALSLICLSPLPRALASQAPDFELTAARKDGMVELTARAPHGHHFNLEAPHFLQLDGSSDRMKPATESKETMVFLAPESARTGSLDAFLCDDANTFCESHRAPFEWNGKVLTLLKDDKPKAVADSATQSGNLDLTADSRGFLVNKPQEALDLARTSKRPLLIDFFGIWCPPCNELDEKVFSSREFQKKSASFVKLKLDSDSDVSWALKSRYRIGGYPTIILASPEGDEIDRIVGYRSPELFIAQMQKAARAGDRTFTALKEKADRGDKAASASVGRTLLERKEYEAARKYLDHLQSEREHYLAAEIGLQDEKKNQPELKKALETAIREFPDSVESIDRRLKLAGIYDDEKNAEKKHSLTIEAVDAARKLIDHPAKLKGTDYTVADLWATIADSYEGLDQKEHARVSWKKAASEFRKRVDSDLERGNNLEVAYCLWKSGDFAGAEAIYSKLEAAYPKEFTYHYARGKMKLEEKKLPEAQALAEKAYEFSYGDNRLRSAQLLVKVLKAEGKKSEALGIVNQTLKSFALPEDPFIRTRVHYQALADLKKELQ